MAANTRPCAAHSALYLACTAALARQEFERQSARVGLVIKKPGLSVAVSVSLERVLDLTDADVLANMQAIRYPSAVHPESCNLVIFEENTGSENLTLASIDDDWPETAGK